MLRTFSGSNRKKSEESSAFAPKLDVLIIILVENSNSFISPIE